MCRRLILQNAVLFILMGITMGLKAQSFTSGLISKPIPNNLNSLYLPVQVSGLPGRIDASFGLESVTLDISHTAVGNLEIYLTAPDGTGVQLSTKNGKDGDNFTNTVFRMDGTSIMKGIAPFTGNYKPEGDFGGVNNGQNPNGNWAIIIIDIKPLDADSGVFNSWSLNFSSTPAQPLNFSSNLPIIDIRTNGQFISDNPKKIVDLGIIYNGDGVRNNLTDPKYFACKSGIEIRGSSSQQFPKKSYSFETLDMYGQKMDTSLLGMPREHDWVLYAPFPDKSLIRNALTYKIYGEMGHYSVRCRFVEVVINRQYQGVYLLVEKIKRDKKRVNIAKLDKEDTFGPNLTGGYIFKVDRVNGKGGDGWTSKYVSGKAPLYFQYEYPSQDSIQPGQKVYLQNYVDSFETALNSKDFNDPVKGYRNFIDVPSFVDNLLMNELSRNTDGYRLSSFFYKNKSNRYGKLCAGPVWDYDIAWSNTEGVGANPKGCQFTQSNADYDIPFWWAKLMTDTMFTNDLYCHYSNFRKKALDKTHLLYLVDSMATLLSEAQDRNFQQWPILGTKVFYEPDPVPADYAGEIGRIKYWIGERLEWMDNAIKGSCARPLGINEKRLAGKIRIFPNPFMTTLFLTYHVYESQEVTVEILNTSGAVVKNIDLGNRSKGEYRENIDIAGLGSGVYILKLHMGENVFNEKLIKTN